MLQTIIIYSIRVLIVSVIISIVFEFINTNNLGWFQFFENYAIGTACSVVIVIVTTFAQFYSERNKALNIFLPEAMTLSFFLYDFVSISDKIGEEDRKQFVDRLIKEIGDYNYYDYELYWFNKKIDDHYIAAHRELNNIILRIKTAPNDIYILTFKDIKNCIVATSNFVDLVYPNGSNFLHDIAVQVQLEAREEAEK